MFQILELKLISDIFVIPLSFLIQLKKPIKNAKTVLVSLLLKTGVKCRLSSCLLFDICHSKSATSPREWYTYKNKKAVSKSHCRILNKNIDYYCFLNIIFLMVLKRQWYIALIKEIIRLKKLAIDQVGSCRITQKFMEDSYISKRKCTLMIFFHEQQSDFRKAVMCNIVS